MTHARAGASTSAEQPGAPASGATVKERANPQGDDMSQGITARPRATQSPQQGGGGRRRPPRRRDRHRAHHEGEVFKDKPVGLGLEGMRSEIEGNPFALQRVRSVKQAGGLMTTRPVDGLLAPISASRHASHGFMGVVGSGRIRDGWDLPAWTHPCHPCHPWFSGANPDPMALPGAWRRGILAAA